VLCTQKELEVDEAVEQMLQTLNSIDSSEVLTASTVNKLRDVHRQIGTLLCTN